MKAITLSNESGIAQFSIRLLGEVEIITTNKKLKWSGVI